MKLTVVGASPAYPNPGSPSSGYLVDHEGTRLLVDCGHGVAGALMKLVPLESVDGVLISHMHPDHFFDLVPLTYAFIAHSLPAIPIWLPPDGLTTLRRLQEAVGLQPEFFADRFAMSEYRPDEAIDMGRIRISFAATHHFIPGYAMRFTPDTAERPSLVFSSDTSWTQPVLSLACDADLALVEAALHDDASDTEKEGHMTPVEAARLAREAQVRRLLLTHYPREAGDLFLEEARREFGPEVALAVESHSYPI